MAHPQPRSILSVRTVVRELELPRSSEASRRARSALASWYATDLPKDELDAAALLASELVTNAVVHGTGQIQLRADLDEDRLRIEVMDEGEGLEHTVREVSFEELGGLGLVIVDTIASRWGIYDGSTHVWTEIELSGPRLGKESAVVT
jgi:anti-sigma regulatory factor (Ser/Thr protein kinase)